MKMVQDTLAEAKRISTQQNEVTIMATTFLENLNQISAPLTHASTSHTPAPHASTPSAAVGTGDPGVILNAHRQRRTKVIKRKYLNQGIYLYWINGVLCAS